MALTAKKVYAILKRQISDMEAKLNSPVRYRGTVATADLLPLNPDIGDMYNIESKSIYGEAGMNVAWNGVVWDTMGAPIDMSLYIKSSELADWAKQPQKPDYTAEEVGALPANTKIPSKTSDLQNDSGFLTKIPDNYLSGTDKTLSASGKAADAKATGDKITELSADISNKLNKNQGSENSGKIAGINESGDIVPMFPVSVDYNEEINCLEFGSDQKMELNKGINLDNTLTKTGYAADAGVTGKKIDSLKEDINDLEETLFNNKSASIIPFHDNWILSDNGVLTENGCSVSDLIPVGNAKRLKLNFSLFSTVKSGRTIQFSTSSTNWQGIISTVTTTEKDKFVEIPTGAVYVRVAFPTNFSNPIISLFENSLKPEANVGTDGIEDGAVTFAKQSFITKEYGENIYNESMMVDAVKSWYWFSGDRIIIQDADDYARITIPIDSTNKYITLSADNINSTYVQIYAWFFVGEDDETIITKDTDAHASFYNGNAITIPIPNNAKSLKLSIRQYSQIIGYDVIMANYGSSKKPYEKYSEELNIDGKKMLVEGSNAIRTSVYINASDTDTKFLLKMLEAYNKGNVDVFVEKGTYVLSNAYDYIRNTLGKTWTCGVPIGNDCRYYFNDSVIISNPPPDNFSDSRNVLDCFAKSNNYEIYDVTLINNGGRYCVHDEGNADAKPYFHKYVNVRMIYNATELSPTDGGSKPFGCGTGFDSSISFDGCEFIKDGGNADIFAIHGVVNNPNNHTVKLRVNMKNCYFNKSGIGINLFDVSRDDVEFMLFGNLWGLNFANDNVRIIANNNNLIN